MIKDGILLYHGSYAEINDIDLSLCDESKDFGRGFYLTESKTQAVSFIKTSVVKAIRNERIKKTQQFGFVTVFKLHLSSDVSCYEFYNVNKDWLYYISINRRAVLAEKLKSMLSEDFDKYDLLVGKIANDDTNMTINAFLAGAFGDILTDMSYSIATQLLKPERLEKQFCFKTTMSVAMLEKIGTERYEI